MTIIFCNFANTEKTFGDKNSMSDFKNIVLSIENKVNTLANQNKILKKQIEKHIEKLEQYEKTINELKNQNKELQTDNYILKIAKSLPEKKDKHKARMKVEELLREIDNCIDLINSQNI